jgi:cytoplasmic iron level regulating protein YaaA (DUF328/UPF0246 family)
VLVLLPPSEGKTAPARGRPLDLAALSHPALTPVRERVLDALVAVSGGPQEPALAALGLPAGLAPELARNAALRTARTAPAARVYTGVLYERLRLPELPKRARDRVLIASALWGVLRPDDRIPAYRLAIGARLPGLPGLPALWRPALSAALPDEGLIVDLRSGGYAAAWMPRAATVVGVRAFTERAGRRTAISHMVKATRGDVARILLDASPPPRTPERVAQLVAAAGHAVELTATPTGATVDVIERG